ncbi:MAG TPA: hypothetical protein VGH39_11940 [Xanthobacteraceae bacterium]|jgi:hypothetical protein
MVLTGPPPGMVSVGGYRFVLAELQAILNGTEHGPASITVLPDALTGYRLSARAADQEGIESTLAILGANPLLANALNERGARGEL